MTKDELIEEYLEGEGRCRPQKCRKYRYQVEMSTVWKYDCNKCTKETLLPIFSKYIGEFDAPRHYAVLAFKEAIQKDLEG